MIHKFINVYLLSIVAMSGVACSTVKIRVPVTRPAEINLKGKENLIVGQVRGPSGPVIEEHLKQAVHGSGRFKLIDRASQPLIEQQRRLSVSQAVQPDSGVELGQQLVGAVLINGRVQHNKYTERVERNSQTCTKKVRKKTVKYSCTRYRRVGEARVEVSFDIVDVSTGQNLRPKTVQCRRSDSSSAVDAQPAALNGEGMIVGCQLEVVGNFMKAIAPWQDYVRVAFRTDGDLPELEHGINFAKTGDWNEAIETFQSAIDKSRTMPDIDADTVAKAHWNLGLAYEYAYEFEKAEASVRKAYDISQDGDYLAEVSSIRRLQNDYQKLQAQSDEGTP